MIGFHGIGNSHMFEDEEMGNYHPEIENGDSNGDNETGIIGALGNKLEKTFKNSLSAMVEQRTSLGLSQRELAAMCGIPQSSVARIESCKTTPNLGTLLNIFQHLGLQLTVRPAKPTI